MSRSTDEIVKIIKEMPENEVRKTLAKIFVSIANIGYGGRTKEQTFEEIKEMYAHTVVYPQIFTKDK
ncbi:hypothetical protein [Paenibacillus ehimensis]|uniref:hypothetical protein n=1 Tax=Paenibacillus ehimensis TaxID=79264 RepID=UPI000FD9E632|nr:hypothetical protein [Paenibacillus ehimensis]